MTENKYLSEEYRGCHITCYYDENADNPLKMWDMITKFYLFGQFDHIGEKHDFNDIEDAMRYLVVNFAPSQAIVDRLLSDDSDTKLEFTDESDDEDGDYIEIFQWFLTNADDAQIGWLEEKFPDLLFTYSDLLGLYVLCVPHCGTPWRAVGTITTNERAAKDGDFN